MRELAVRDPKTASNGHQLPVRAKATWLLLSVVALVLACAASLAIGARDMSLETVWQALTQYNPDDGNHAVVHTRIPRTVLGLVAGAALGLAGAAMQGVSRNPLADPGIMGVNAGAALAVVTGIYLFRIYGASGYIWFAFVGAAAAAVVVYLIASMGRDGATPVKLALAGAALSAGLYSVMNVILVSSQDTLDRFRFWQVGGIAGIDWSVILTGVPFLLLGALIVLGSGRILNTLALGDDIARGLGQNVALVRGVTALVHGVLAQGQGRTLSCPPIPASLPLRRSLTFVMFFPDARSPEVSGRSAKMRQR